MQPDVPFKKPPPSAAAHKNILLMDANRQTREARAQVLRARGATVECVANADAARSLFRTAVFSLVLLDPGMDINAAERLADEFRAQKPRQLVAFLVGRPAYVALHPRPQPVRTRTATARGQSLEAPPRPSAALDFGQRVRAAAAAAETANPSAATEEVA